MKLIEIKPNIINNNYELLLEMPKIPPKFVGLKYPVWIFEVGGQHAGRLKIGNHVYTKTSKSDCFVMQISNDPKVVKSSTSMNTEDLAKIKLWMKYNFETLKLMQIALEKNNNGNYEQHLNNLKSIQQIYQEMKLNVK